MTETSPLTITAWTDPNDRVKRVRDILGQLPGVPDGKRFWYRGLALEKREAGARSRQHPEIDVYDPAGRRRTRLQPDELSSGELTAELDAIRRSWVNEQRAEAL